MILIEVTNVDELVRKNKGRIASLIGSFVTDVEAEVEKVIIERLKEAFAEDGVQAKIASVRGVDLGSLDLDFDEIKYFKLEGASSEKKRDTP